MSKLENGKIRRSKRLQTDEPAPAVPVEVVATSSAPERRISVTDLHLMPKIAVATTAMMVAIWLLFSAPMSQYAGHELPVFGVTSYITWDMVYGGTFLCYSIGLSLATFAFGITVATTKVALEKKNE